MKGVLAEREKTQAREITIYTRMGCKNSLEETKSIICELMTGIFTGTAKLSHSRNTSFKTTKKSSVVSKGK